MHTSKNNLEKSAKTKWWGRGAVLGYLNRLICTLKMQKRAIKNPSRVNSSVLYQYTVRKTDSAQWAQLGVPHVNRGSSKHYWRQEKCSQQLYWSRLRTKKKNQKFDAWYCNTQFWDIINFKWPITLEEKFLHKSGALYSLTKKAQNIHKDHSKYSGAEDSKSLSPERKSASLTTNIYKKIFMDENAFHGPSLTEYLEVPWQKSNIEHTHDVSLTSNTYEVSQFLSF